MKESFNEISVQYWYENRKYIQSKSYFCFHDGYVYGDNMQFEKICFVFDNGDNEIVIDEGSPTKTYIKFVEVACNQSNKILNGFQTAKAEKFRIFSERAVSGFTDKQRNSTRIRDESSAIIISGEKYYVANNLKICETFNAVADALTEEYRKKWFIRVIFCNDYRNAPLKVVDELQAIEAKAYDRFKLLIEDKSNSVSKGYGGKGGKSHRIDYLTLNSKKKSIGDLGEYIVIEHEKSRLCEVGLEELAKQIEHTSRVVGDNEGYDIKSFTETGEVLYIEVKSTEQDHDCGFYISQNEVNVANKMWEQGGNYRIYRLYKIDRKKGEACLRIYEPPFNDKQYEMKTISWYVESRI